MEEARKYLREKPEDTARPATVGSTVGSTTPAEKTRGDTGTLTGVTQLDTILRRLDTPKTLFPPAAQLPLNQAFGCVLSDAVSADRDQPPFNRAAMDGIAVRSADIRNGAINFSIKGILPAGSNPAEFRSPKTGDAVEIMTGAPLPDGYDTVIRLRIFEDRRQKRDFNFSGRFGRHSLEERPSPRFGLPGGRYYRIKGKHHQQCRFSNPGQHRILDRPCSIATENHDLQYRI